MNALQPGAFESATLRFLVLAQGAAPLNPTVRGLGDEQGRAIAATFQGGGVTAVVPELASAVLVVVGGALVVASRPRRRR